MRDITGLKFDKTIQVYICLPGLHWSFQTADTALVYCISDSCQQNLFPIFLWHNILHTYLNNDPLNGAVIDFATNYELRSRLEGKRELSWLHESLGPCMLMSNSDPSTSTPTPNIRPNFLPQGYCHFPREMRILLLADWQEYMASKNRNIIEFAQRVKQRHVVLE